MSTRELRHALNLLEEALGDVPAVELARAELQAIERAARDMTSLYATLDFVAWDKASRLLECIAKESKP